MSWIQAHPQYFWLILSFTITALFHPRTAADYAAMPPRLAAFLHVIASLGIDPVKFMDAVKVITTGKKS